ncbi:DUF2142 domain-containing protein [Curtobacterium sp. NPDC090217]|uniref:DUF2142 domain-containing protein n=1 Tax=Curtobacterium sp. NPDC090217 TaxID=3363970 RepID=UPI0037F14613
MRVFLSAFAVFLGLSMSWAMVSPLMAVPDEPSHTIHAAAVVRGQLTGEPGTHPSWKYVQVPEYVERAESQLCFAQHPEVSAACAAPLTHSAELVRARTTAGTYNPLYYAAVGLPSLWLSGPAAIYAMRLVSCLISALLLAGAVVAVTRTRSSGFTLLALAVGVSPMVLFLSGAVNPSGTEFASAAMAFAWLHQLARSARLGRVPWREVACVVGAAIVLVNTRPIAIAWLAVFIVATLADLGVIRMLVRSRVFWGGVLVIGAAVAGSAAWTISTASLSVSHPGPGAGMSFPRAFVYMVGLSLDYIRDYVGIFGWFDTTIPTGTTVAWGAAFLLPVGAAIVFGRGRAWRTTVLMAAALVLVPAVVQGRTAHDFGLIWQGRYNIALLLGLMLAAGSALDAAFPDAFAAPRMVVMAAAGTFLLAFMHVHTFLWVARRYAVGANGEWGTMLRAPAWQPPGSWELWTAILAVAAVTGGAAVVHRIRRSRPDEDGRSLPRWAPWGSNPRPSD